MFYLPSRIVIHYSAFQPPPHPPTGTLQVPLAIPFRRSADQLQANADQKAAFLVAARHVAGTVSVRGKPRALTAPRQS
jgi:hypothetical protein